MRKAPNSQPWSNPGLQAGLDATLASACRDRLWLADMRRRGVESVRAAILAHDRKTHAPA